MKLKRTAFFERTMLTAAGLSILAAACKSPLSDLSWKSWLLDRAPYALLWGLTACWLLAVIQVLKECGRPAVTIFIQRSWVPVACIIAIAAIVFFLVKPDFRVSVDEANLLAASKAMATESRLDYTTEGYWQKDRYIGLSRSAGIRPFGFPFAVHWAHRLTGFRPENVFAVNFILFVGFLSFIYVLVRQYAGSAWSTSAVFAVLAQPLVLLCATSGGFELFQVFWISAALTAWLFYSDSPQSEPRFCLAWMSLIVLAHARYESVLFFLMVIPAVFLTRTAPWAFVRRNPVYAVSCVFLLPLLWQRIAHAGYRPAFVARDIPLWSLEWFIQNLRLFADTLFHPRQEWPYNWLLNAIGMISIFWGIWLFLKNVRTLDTKTKTVLLSFAGAAAFEIAGLTAYIESALYFPESSRYFLLGSVVLSIAAVFGIRRILDKKNGRAAAAFCLVLFVISLPVAMTNLQWKKSRKNFEWRFVKSFLDRESLDPRQTLLIVFRPTLYASLGYGAVSFARVHSNPAEFAYFFDSNTPGLRVFAVQEYFGESLSKKTALPAGWVPKRVDRIEDRSGLIWEINELKDTARLL